MQPRHRPNHYPHLLPLLPSTVAVFLLQLPMPTAPAVAHIFFFFFPLRTLLNLFSLPMLPLPSLPLHCCRFFLNDFISPTSSSVVIDSAPSEISDAARTRFSRA
ncbi:hypothetical protein BHE74_00015486 [Ensete ventricosum]|nr:hypothetical protein GW17_00027626 [Ensete ventricosum]RWW76426.1 hypothetical protein BHE74_00015486 [Ensete ventricosum]RZR85455.1 hypothetical protein BHM03_00012443 [Ensete ventricosum]